MDNEVLIESILKKVIEELKKIEEVEMTKSNNDEKIINFLGDDTLLKDELSKKVKIQDNLNLRNKWSDISDDSNSKKVVISTLCIDGLISIAQGKRNFVIDTLLNNGQVYVVEEGIIYKQYTTPKMLLKTYDEYLEKIKSYGIKIIKRDEILSLFEKKEGISIHGIITESKLRKLDLRNKRIILNSNNKITSLAQDYIKQNNIEVQSERG